jgi:replicative DNA helicase
MNDEKETDLPRALIPEDSILAAMMADSHTWVTRAKSEGLVPDMFYRPENRTIYRRILKRHEAKLDCNFRPMIHDLEKAGEYERSGGDERMEMLMAVAESPVTPSQFAEHLEEVRDTYARRRAITHALRAKETALSGDSSQEVIDALKGALDDLQLATARKKAFQTIAESLRDAQREMMERLEKGQLPGISTGIRELDQVGGGMKPGEFWVISGKTSGGKSALSYQVINPALDAGRKVLIFTLEMSCAEVATRLIACRGRINMRAMTNPQNAGRDGRGLEKGQIEAIKRAASNLAEKHLLISDEPGMTIDYIVSQSEMEAEMGSVDVIVVDYIQLIQGSRLTGENREQELSRYSKDLKQLAKRLKCTVISPAQLNDEGRIRESRSLSHDADVVLSITDDGVRVDKWRSAARDKLLPLHLVGEYQRFEVEG